MATVFDYDEWVEVYARDDKTRRRELQGSIDRSTLTKMGLHLHSNKLSATRFQLMALKQQPTWKDAKE
jgi:hypothetical protein